MSDIFSRKKRSQIMSRIRAYNTKPEVTVRSLIHKMGFRFRLHNKNLPGTPDIVLPKYKKIIFIHGCFWHGHKGCKRSSLPKSNSAFWKKKISTNILRDKKTRLALKKQGWNVMVIWECKTKNSLLLSKKLCVFLK